MIDDKIGIDHKDHDRHMTKDMDNNQPKMSSKNDGKTNTTVAIQDR